MIKSKLVYLNKVSSKPKRSAYKRPTLHIQTVVHKLKTMQFEEDILIGLGCAFNEAELLGVEFDSERKLVACTLNLLAIDVNGNIPDDRRIQLILKPISRIVASLRNGHWDDDLAPAVNFAPDKLLKIVQSFNASSIYGWEFINCQDDGFNRWKNRPSFDWKSDNYTGKENTFDLFQEDGSRHLDIRIWFDDLITLNSKGKQLEISNLIETSNRVWEAINENSEVTKEFGIIPLGSDPKLDI